MTCEGTKVLIDGKEVECLGGGFAPGRFDDDGRPVSVVACPCRIKKIAEDYIKERSQIFGVIPVVEETRLKVTLRDSQKECVRLWNLKNSLYLWGPTSGGKTYVAWYISAHIKDPVDIFIGKSWADKLRHALIECGSQWPYKEVVIIDDIDKNKVSDYTQEELWFLIDAADKKKLRLLFTSNLSPEDFVSRYCKSEAHAATMLRRLTNIMQVVKI
jgi:hypothetical protein